MSTFNISFKVSKRKIILAFILVVTSNTTFALTSIIGNVTRVEPTYLPTSVAFQISTGISPCPAGTWLKWSNTNTSNNLAVYDTLMTALTTGKTVQIYINNGDTTCTGKFLHLIK